MATPKPEGIVYEGDPESVRLWCVRLVGAGWCNYTWKGIHGWHVTIVTANGYEILRHGDAVIHVGDRQLAIVRKEEL